jgi:uncharacterized protein Yka (UPF0111/DUF47 family)
MKTEVLAAIGEDGLRRPAAVNAALAANDRIKFAFTLLQAALAHADHPEQPADNLRRERIACGIDDLDLDGLIAATRRQGSRYLVPGVPRLLARIGADLRVMAAPLLAAPPSAAPLPAAGHPEVAARLDALLTTMPVAENDLLDAGAVAAMTRLRHGGVDSLHQLVMDLHKELNALQAGLAQETLEGAAVYALAETDRPRVVAFMAGLNRTARLKGDHPGLGTTATRSGDRLVIQNDIGTTDAHVIVVHVDGLVVSVTYTDVHPERLAFFQSLLERYQTEWSTAQSGTLAAGAAFHLATGRYTAADEAGCRAYLEFLGSRLVFLIDWNRARKQLRAFLPGAARLALLRWAADQEVGHRGFLELGGARLINQAIEATAGSAMHFGDRLSDVLGVPDTEAFLRFVFRAATDGLLARRSPSFVRDRVRAELLHHFSNEERRLLQLAAEHAALVFELASLTRDGVLAVTGGADSLEKLARRAHRFEHDADQLVIDAREAVRRRPEYGAFRPLIEASDDAADELEEAVFLLGMLAAAKPDGPVLGPLRTLAGLLDEAAREWVKALGHATHVREPGAADDTDDFLTAIDRIAALEHQTDDAERALTAAAVRHAADFRQLHLYAALGSKLEAACDALKHASLVLRDHILAGLASG